MKVFIKPDAHLSQAMFRVERALMAYAPANIEFVADKDSADLVLLHVIGHPETVAETARLQARGQKYVIAQYTLRSSQEPNTKAWRDMWANAAMVWSYYNLHQLVHDDGGVWHDENFYHSPLGADAEFRKPISFADERPYGALTSGYVSAYCAEAIEEMAYAALSLGMTVNHLGPVPVGLEKPLPSNWTTQHGISDQKLAEIYRSTKWVSGLRHCEGFELPAVEGLCCGARPIVFDRPEMRTWYAEHAVYVPECSGDQLITHLVDVMCAGPVPVSRAERQHVLDRFNWESIVTGFWERVL